MATPRALLANGIGFDFFTAKRSNTIAKED
jgi:hypothetical protein